MPCGSESVEISTKAEISAEDFLGIITALVGLLVRTIIFFISDRGFTESAFALGQTTCQREVGSNTHDEPEGS